MSQELIKRLTPTQLSYPIHVTVGASYFSIPNFLPLRLFQWLPLDLPKAGDNFLGIDRSTNLFRFTGHSRIYDPNHDLILNLSVLRTGIEYVGGKPDLIIGGVGTVSIIAAQLGLPVGAGGGGVTLSIHGHQLAVVEDLGLQNDRIYVLQTNTWGVNQNGVLFCKTLDFNGVLDMRQVVKPAGINSAAAIGIVQQISTPNTSATTQQQQTPSAFKAGDYVTLKNIPITSYYAFKVGKLDSFFQSICGTTTWKVEWSPGIHTYEFEHDLVINGLPSPHVTQAQAAGCISGGATGGLSSWTPSSVQVDNPGWHGTVKVDMTPECECGAESVKSNVHSSWCKKFS